jgi:hypothetical protein
MHHVMMMAVVDLQSATALYGVLMKKSRCTTTVCYTLHAVCVRSCMHHDIASHMYTMLNVSKHKISDDVCDNMIVLQRRWAATSTCADV